MSTDKPRSDGRHSTSCRLRRGTAAVEMALIAPLLMLIVLGCVDFGRFAYTYIAVTNAARAAAAYASVTPVDTTSTTKYAAWKTAVEQYATREMGTPFQSASLTFVPAPSMTEGTTTNSKGQTVPDPTLVWVTVTVSCPFTTIVNWLGIPRNMTITRQVKMRTT